jgi:hypothetical protein
MKAEGKEKILVEWSKFDKESSINGVFIPYISKI